MAKQGFRVIDSEPHLEEPYDLWDRRLPDKYRPRLKLITPPQGHLEVGPREPEIEREGDAWTVDLAGSREKEKSLVWVQGMRRWKTTPHLAEARAPYSRPEVYLHGFDTEGVDVGVLMPTTFGHIMSYDGYDPGLAQALCQAYNDWTYEWTRRDPKRFRWWATVPIQDPTAAAREARRCIRELDAVGITAKDGGGLLANDDLLEPFWAELDDLQAPMGFHGVCEGRNVRPGDPGHRRVQFIKGFAGPHATSLAGLIFGGVLDKFPNMKPVFMESGVNGLPYLLEQMDDKWFMYGPDQDFKMQTSAKESYVQHCYSVTFAEGLLQYTIAYLGDDNLLFSTDYPHHDAPYPNGVQHFLELEGVSDESKRKILWDNGAKLFGIEAQAEQPVSSRNDQ